MTHPTPCDADQEPEAAKPAEEEKKADETNGREEAPKEAPKGLPALGPRKKKAGTAEAAKQVEA